jgi:putative endonuclease
MNVEIRLDEHLQHSMDDAFTKRSGEWVVFYQLECNCRRQALLIEHHIKMMKSRMYLENLKKYQEISNRLLEKYQ